MANRLSFYRKGRFQHVEKLPKFHWCLQDLLVSITHVPPQNHMFLRILILSIISHPFVSLSGALAPKV